MLWDYITPLFQPSTQPNPDPTPLLNNIVIETLTPDNHSIPSSMPPHTLVNNPLPNSTGMDDPPLIAQQMLLPSDKSNAPWGDTWAVGLPINTFQILSKNTGTINPQNLDAQAITTELHQLGASVFAAQETNIHWDPATTYQIYQQCKCSMPQFKLSTATSQEPAADWYKPGSTMLITLNPWTTWVIAQGSDHLLGRWTYQEFVGKHDKRVIVVSAYRVCNQKFDAASMTITAQQI